jgi:hypothetical protein
MYERDEVKCAAVKARPRAVVPITIVAIVHMRVRLMGRIAG